MFGQFDITPMNEEHWEEREPTDEDLGNVRSALLRSILKSEKYWSIKKFSERNPRSVDPLEEESPKKEDLTKGRSRYLWSKFVVDLMTISVEARSKGDSFVWLKNFTRLFNDYMLDEKKSTNVHCPPCSSFDEYLYLKISTSSDWQRCVSGTNGLREWCAAYGRIMMNLDVASTNSFKKYKINKPRSKLYIKEVDKLMNWLSSKISTNQCKRNEPTLIELPYNPYQPVRRTNSVIDRAICYMVTVVTLLSTFKNDCHKIFD